VQLIVLWRETVNTIFEQEIFDWFKALPPVKELKELAYPNKEVVKYIESFFYREIFNTRSTATDIIDV
jgi:hypothetical protein